MRAMGEISQGVRYAPDTMQELAITLEQHREITANLQHPLTDDWPFRRHQYDNVPVAVDSYSGAVIERD